MINKLCEQLVALIFLHVCFSFLGSLAGISLALFGGVRKHSMDQNKVPVRGDIHVMVVGMLIFCHSCTELHVNFNISGEGRKEGKCVRRGNVTFHL